MLEGTLNTSARILKNEGIECILVETAERQARFFVDEELAKKASSAKSSAYAFSSLATDLKGNTVTFSRLDTSGQTTFWTYRRDKSFFTTVSREISTKSRSYINEGEEYILIHDYVVDLRYRGN